MILEDDAIFIADAHYPHHNSRLINLLQKIQNGEIETKQLFLMGDIFDLLFGKGRYIYNYNKEAIEYINLLSKSISIIYLEGNHDFNLKNIFPNIEVIPRDKQPFYIYNIKGDLYALSHGDKFETDLLYNIYTAIIRSPIIIYLLLPFERIISKIKLDTLSNKKICGKIKEFKKIVYNILLRYPENATVIEGHYHQGVQIKRYIALPSLACSDMYTLYKNGEFLFQNI